MATENPPVLTAHGQLTKKSDKKGIDVFVCDPGWFDPIKKFKISNAPTRTASLEFDGADLNFMARVLYAESSGILALPDKAERDNEKEAILNVNHFRLNRTDYPNRRYVATTFRMVCEAVGQFESVSPTNQKLINSDDPAFNNLIKAECADLAKAIEALKRFLATGPNGNYVYDNFRGYNPTGSGTHIGRSRFWLSTRGKELSDKTP
jgi:hypothetical protein